MEDHPPRPNKLRGWWGIVALVVVCLLIVLAVFFWWYHSTADLEQIRAEAKKRGIPTTWVEAGVVASPADVLAKYERLGVLSGLLNDYDTQAQLSKFGKGHNERLLPFLPIPPAAVEHHASFDPALIREYLAIIDSLPRTPLIRYSDRTLATMSPHLGWQRRFFRLQSERILLATTDSLTSEVERALHLLEISESHSWTELMTLCSCVGIITPKIASRISDVRVCMPDLPEQFDRLAARLDSALTDCFIGEFLTTEYSTSHIEEVLSRMRSLSASRETDWFAGAMIRAGRYSLLTQEIEWVEMARRPSSLADRLADTKLIRAQGKALRRWVPTETLSHMTVNVIPHVLVGMIEAKLSVEILAAELRGNPWPNDPFDPAGAPLRRLERDGKLMGVYSVHENGVDDGGKKGKDRYFPLYGPLDPPTPTAPTASP